MLADTGKITGLVFVAALLQIGIFSSLEVAGGAADLVLVTLVAVAILRGSLAGAGTGFFAGLLLDTATLQTLGLTSLLLTVAGFWTGRYAETSGRDRRGAPVVVAVVTVLYAIASLALHVLLGDPVSVRYVLVDTLVPTVALNVLLCLAVFRIFRAALPPLDRLGRAREVQLIG